MKVKYRKRLPVSIKGTSIHELALHPNKVDELTKAIRYEITQNNTNKYKKKTVSLSDYIHADGDLIIRCAARHNNIELLNWALENGANPCAHDNQPIKVAAKYGYYTIMKRLLDDGRVNICIDVNAPMRYAMEQQNYDIINLLYEYGAVIVPYSPYTQYGLYERDELNNNLKYMMDYKKKQYNKYCDQVGIIPPEIIDTFRNCMDELVSIK